MWRKNLEEKIHRREWAQTDNPLVDEARAQTLAIQRLQVWLRLGYAVLAVAVLLAYWGFGDDAGDHAAALAVVAGVIGVALGVLTLAVVIVLRVGITHGRQNVNAMLEDIQSSVSSSKGSGTPDASNASNASGAASAATGTASK